MKMIYSIYFVFMRFYYSSLFYFSVSLSICISLSFTLTLSLSLSLSLSRSLSHPLSHSLSHTLSLSLSLSIYLSLSLSLSLFYYSFYLLCSFPPPPFLCFFVYLIINPIGYITTLLFAKLTLTLTVILPP